MTNTQKSRIYDPENERLIVVRQDESLLPRIAQLSGRNSLVDWAVKKSDSMKKFNYLIAAGKTFGTQRPDEKVIQVGVVGNYEESKPSLGNINQIYRLVEELVGRYHLGSEEILTYHEFAQKVLDDAEAKRGLVFDVSERDMHKHSSLGLDEVVVNLRNEIALNRLKNKNSGVAA